MKIVFDTLPYLLDGLGFSSPSVDLRPAGDARFHAMAGGVVSHRVLIEHVAGLCGGRVGPRPDDRHVAAQDVEELRELVEARPPQETPQPRDASIVSTRELLAFLVAQRVMHGAEFPYLEKMVVVAEPALPSGDR